MDGQHQIKRRKPKNNVIPFRLDAAFFFERAVRHLDRHNLKDAVKYFRKAAEYEPDNPVNHCNLAGVLSEMGQYEESNEILEHILQSIDPNMHECLFYLANNWANLNQFDKAEEYVARYLELDPNGEFVKDAEEMLDILIEEFGGGDVLRQRMEEKAIERREQDKARKLLEQGKFMEATAYLKRTIEEHPDLLSPRNNLSLAYYYLGQLDSAVATALNVLELDPGNLHARCNLAVFYHHLGHQEEMEQILQGLRILYPMNIDQAYKLATTMGILGEHAAAHRLFLHLVKWSDKVEAPLLHCVAASAANSGEYADAKRIWQDILLMDPKSEVAAYYLRMLQTAETDQSQFELVTYQYQIPFHEQFKQMQETLQTGKTGNWQNDPLIRSSLFWALRHGDLETKMQVIQTFALIRDNEVEHALREFILRPDEVGQLRTLARYVLQHMGAEVPKVSELEQGDNWQQIFDKAWTKLEPIDKHLYNSLREIWSDYLVKSRQRVSRILNTDAWAAALVYLVLHGTNAAVTQRQAADWFAVSSATVSQTAAKISKYIES